MSLFMVGQFLFPLLLGAGAAKLLQRRGKAYPDSLTLSMWRLGTVTLTLASCLTGVFEIYGAPAPLVQAHWYAGAALSHFPFRKQKQQGGCSHDRTRRLYAL